MMVRSLGLSLVLAVCPLLAWADATTAPSAPKAESHPPSALADGLKAARAKALTAEQTNQVRVIAQSLLHAKKEQAANDPRSTLATELEKVRNELVTQRTLHLNDGIKAIPPEKATSSESPPQHERRAALVKMATRLRDTRATLAPSLQTHPQLADALDKIHALEAELNEIATLPPDAQTQRLNDLSVRLTPHHISDFAVSGPVQPTLTMRHPARREP